MNDTYTLTQAEYTRLKSRLTRAQNVFRKTEGDTFKAVAARAVIEEVDSAFRIFEAKGHPDAWSNWDRARIDAKFWLSHKGL